jgi:hypothetical protein
MAFPEPSQGLQHCGNICALWRQSWVQIPAPQFLALQPWTSDLILLSLLFLIFKMRGSRSSFLTEMSHRLTVSVVDSL